MFIKPIRHSSYTLNRFAKHEDIAVSDNQLFRLQKRKRPSDSNTSYNFRIITRGNPYYEIAVSNDLNQLKEREWRYIIEEVPNRLPPNLNEKALVTWITSHFTCLAMEIGDGLADQDCIDNDDDDEQGRDQLSGSDVSSTDPKSAALSAYNRNLANGTGNTSMHNLIPITTWQLYGILPLFIAMALTNTPILFLREVSTRTFTIAIVVWNIILLCVVFFGFPMYIGISRLGTLNQLAPRQFRRHHRLLNLNYSDSDDETAPVDGAMSDGGDNSANSNASSSKTLDGLQGGSATHVTPLGYTPGCSLKCSSSDNTPEQLINTYSDPQGESFSLRCGPDYKNNKLKAPSSSSLFDLVGLDVFQSKSKIKHIAKYINKEHIYSLNPAPYVSLGTDIDQELAAELEKQKAAPLSHVTSLLRQNQIDDQEGRIPSSVPFVYPDATDLPESTPEPYGERLPGFHFGTMEKPFLFIVSMQIPTTAPAFMASGDQDGPGMALVWYLRAKPETQRDLLRDNPICPAVRILKQFILINPSDPKFTEWMNRMKTIPRLVNHEEFDLNWTLKKLVKQYNAKPFLTRPQHIFHSGPGYFNYDLDIHNFCYTARKVLYSFLDKMDRVVLDWGFTVEAFDDDEQPEVMIGQMRIYKIQYQQFPSWEATLEALEHAKKNPNAAQSLPPPGQSSQQQQSSSSGAATSSTTRPSSTTSSSSSASANPNTNDKNSKGGNALNSPSVAATPSHSTASTNPSTQSNLGNKTAPGGSVSNAPTANNKSKSPVAMASRR